MADLSRAIEVSPKSPPSNKRLVTPRLSRHMGANEGGGLAGSDTEAKKQQLSDFSPEPWPAPTPGVSTTTGMDPR
ncbi:MAG: hypothetical protein LQ338_002580 [Usnochroma carphineum]|nr:MAG: hypothetical protein LQ338_002580 [Usnochroma carphineum]